MGHFHINSGEAKRDESVFILGDITYSSYLQVKFQNTSLPGITCRRRDL